MKPEEAALFHSAPVALLTINLNGEVLEHNAGLGQWLGGVLSTTERHQLEPSQARDLRGRNLIGWLTPASRMLYETKLMPTLQERGVVREVILQTRDSAGHTTSVLINAQLRTTPTGERVVFIAAIDAAERIAFERELVQARRSAELAHERLAVLQAASSQLALAEGIDDLGAALVTAAGRTTQAGWVSVRIEHDESSLGNRETTRWGKEPIPGTSHALRSDGAAAQQERVCRNWDDLRAALPIEAELLREAGAEALVRVPILRQVDGRSVVLGEILCCFRRNRALDDEMLETLRALAVQAELVIDHLRLRQRLRHRALHDGLTGLPNRMLLEDRLQQLVAGAVRTQAPCAVLFLDLDGFKAINDRLGHGVGDDVLRTVADRLRSTCRADETVSRLGGDEFVIALSGADEAGTTGIAERVWSAIRKPLPGEAADMSLSSSIGGVWWEPGSTPEPPTATQLVHRADGEMYRAKHRGKDGISIARFE